MKNKFLILVLFSGVLFSCQKEAVISFTNPLGLARQDETLVLSREFLAERVTIQEDLLPVLTTQDGQLMPTQVDDIDDDGNWDEVILLTDFQAKETINATVKWVPVAEFPKAEQRTNLRLGIVQEDGSYKEVDQYNALPCDDGFEIISQAEGVNWENDKIGFRVYFDCRNVKDLFGKRMPTMIVDKVHTPEMGSYHNLADWGMDVLHCGSSLGSGGLALLRNDSLFRLGSTKVYEYKKIAEGPLRSVFELRYEGWDVDGEQLKCVEKITIYPGKYWFESDVTVTGSVAGDQIVTGIVTSHLQREPFAFESAGFQCIGTHDVQSLNNDELGMAVLVPKEESGKIGRTTDINFYKLGFETVPEKKFSHIISETYYIGQKFTENNPAKHYFFSVWGLDKDQWKTEEGFRKYIDEESVRLSNPVIVN